MTVLRQTQLQSRGFQANVLDDKGKLYNTYFLGLIAVTSACSVNPSGKVATVPRQTRLQSRGSQAAQSNALNKKGKLYNILS